MDEKKAGQCFLSWIPASASSSSRKASRRTSGRETGRHTRATSALILCLRISANLSAYYVAFGPHGPRKPMHPPNYGITVFLITSGCIASAVAVFAIFRYNGASSPLIIEFTYSVSSPTTAHHDSRMARSSKRVHAVAKHEPNCEAPKLHLNAADHQSGISSEGYKGKGMVTLP